MNNVDLLETGEQRYWLAEQMEVESYNIDWVMVVVRRNSAV